MQSTEAASAEDAGETVAVLANWSPEEILPGLLVTCFSFLPLLVLLC